MGATLYRCGTAAMSVLSISRMPRTERLADRSVVGQPSPPYIFRAHGGSRAIAVPAMPKYAHRVGPNVSPSRTGRLPHVTGTGGTVRNSAVSTLSLVSR